MAEDLVLDTAIRDWVLIPLSVVMVLIGVLRYFVSKLMRSDQVPDPKIVKEGQITIRARNLRAAANFIPAKSFRARRYYYSNEENGLLHVPKGQAQNAQAQMFSDPNMAMDMMKKNLSMIIPQDSAYLVSSKNSISAYSEIQGNVAEWNRFEYCRRQLSTDDTQRMMQMSGFGMDPTRSLGAEKNNLDIVQHDWALPRFEQRAAAALKKLLS
ncbi:hypothetical protein DH2020_033010 [Rehmannia glutinosa]|uniref:ER membrane protein complex subunit 3 n=1 Tax=Rehmannia glutinosa TaxID=99300 RepID=A0ABR0VGA1_REHGL